MENSQDSVMEENQTSTLARTQEGVIQDIHEFAPDPEALIKALIFSTPEYISVKTIKEVVETLDSHQIRTYIKKINQKLTQNNEPFEIVETNNTYRFRTRPTYYPWVRKLYKEAATRRLSPAALEILAIIAYKQPITKAEVEDIRGVNVDGTLRGLLDKKLVSITGKSEKVGNAFTYGTTKEFLQYFNINKVPDDLPKLSEFENMIQNSALIPQINRSGDVVEMSEDIEEDFSDAE